jgi:hypothetical protein
MFLRFVALFAVAVVGLLLFAQSPAAQTDLAASVERQLPALTETYKHLHRNPELSRHEEQKLCGSTLPIKNMRKG